MRVLLLGGTAEARALAAVLVEQGVAVVSSLAGRVARPRLPLGEVRVGGFGGVAGLRDYLTSTGVDAVVDATHPFAARISANTVSACGGDVPLLRLERPGWSMLPGSEAWHWVRGNAEAAEVTARLGERPFLTVGRQGLEEYVAPLRTAAVLARVVDPPQTVLPASWTVLEDRGPYDEPGERAVILGHRADVLVTKDSGGDHTRPKLDAALALGMPVVVLSRPPVQPGVRTVHHVRGALDWLSRSLS